MLGWYTPGMSFDSLDLNGLWGYWTLETQRNTQFTIE
jgi:hypothetical protein